MSLTNKESKEILREFGDGLVLRRSTPADTEALAEFNARVHSDFGWDNPFEPIRSWVRDLMTHQHPTFSPGDFTIVENIHNGQIVSSLNLISQTWSYAGLPFKVGRPELVGTHLEYRNRGLIRAQFEEIHRWSEERGEMVQVITGIPYYYRLFGYEMALNLGGGRTGFLPHIPHLEKEKTEPFRIRPAVLEDLPFIMELYEIGLQRNLLGCLRDRQTWEYELHGHSENSVNGRALQVVETADGEPVGFFAHPRMLWGRSQALGWFELKPGISWLSVTPSVIRFLEKTGLSYAEQNPEEPCQAFTFALGAEHPAYEAVFDRLPRVFEPYAYYVRVPDLPAFLALIKPVLEERLDKSVAVGYSGELKISFYRDGLKLIFENGSIEAIESWRPEPVGHAGDAVFPGLTFLQLLFGYRSLEELRHAFPDVGARGDAARVLLRVLFPKQSSDVWPIS
jgi:hypothetical protein